jgi:hypothetical protein
VNREILQGEKMRLSKWIPALLAGLVLMALNQSVQAQFTIIITDQDNGDQIKANGVASGSTTGLDFNTLDGGTTFSVKTTLNQGNPTSIVACITATTGTGASAGDSYSISVINNTQTSVLNGAGIGGTLTASLSTDATDFNTNSTINNKATYKPGPVVTSATLDATGPGQTPTPKTKSVGVISTFTLSELSTYQSTAGATDKWCATASVKPVYAVPEPTGMLIGLVGLPCLGAVVFFSRRRFSESLLVA